MVIIYKTSWLTYAIARSVIKIPYIGLVNIVAGKKIADELIQRDANAINIAHHLETALHNPQIIEELAAVKNSLGDPYPKKQIPTGELDRVVIFGSFHTVGDILATLGKDQELVSK